MKTTSSAARASKAGSTARARGRDEPHSKRAYMWDGMKDPSLAVTWLRRDAGLRCQRWESFISYRVSKRYGVREYLSQGTKECLVVT